jgi:two-component system response regulator AtoC
VQSGNANRVLLLDISAGDDDTLHFMRWLRKLRPEVPVIAVCHAEDAALADEALELGAEDVLFRPLDAERLQSAICRYFEPALFGSADMVEGNVEEIGQNAFFFTASPVMRKLRSQAELLAQTDVPVLITGEKGSGKNTVASLIHKLSVRSGFKLLTVQCAEMPSTLLEVEIFGEQNRSFGGARRTSLGKFDSGEMGTLFLDEITAMPLDLQSRLLQVLRNQEAANSAGSAPPAEVRILAGSSVNLDRALTEKRLREDLYYRLSAFTVHVPALRHRKEEIGVLLRYFMYKLAKHYRMPSREFLPSVIEAVERYSWPGNLKEMETFVKRYLVSGDPQVPARDHAPKFDEICEPPIAARIKSSPSLLEHKPFGVEQKPESLKSLIQGIKSVAEQNAIGAALKRTGWNRKAAARLLSVSYRTLLYKIEQYQMRAPESIMSSSWAEFSMYRRQIKDDGEAN